MALEVASSASALRPQRCSHRLFPTSVIAPIVRPLPLGLVTNRRVIGQSRNSCRTDCCPGSQQPGKPRRIHFHFAPHLTATRFEPNHNFFFTKYLSISLSSLSGDSFHSRGVPLISLRAASGPSFEHRLRLDSSASLTALILVASPSSDSLPGPTPLGPRPKGEKQKAGPGRMAQGPLLLLGVPAPCADRPHPRAGALSRPPLAAGRPLAVTIPGPADPSHCTTPTKRSSGHSSVGCSSPDTARIRRTSHIESDCPPRGRKTDILRQHFVRWTASLLPATVPTFCSHAARPTGALILAPAPASGRCSAPAELAALPARTRGRRPG